MAVLGRILLSSGERVDLADFLSIDSYTAGDLQKLLTGFVGSNTPYILQGFDVIQPQNAVGTQNCSINVSTAAVFYPGSTTGPFYFGLPSDTPLVPSLVQNATNYVYLTLSTTNAAADSRAFWDPDANGGTGAEFSQEVDTESVLEAQINVSTGSFPSGTVPVAIIVMGATVITSIEDARPLMFRLGTGGINPNPYNRFAWPALPNSSFEREEPPNTIVSGGVNPFQGADKNIQTLKEWMDAVMSKLAELGGTTYWYEDAVAHSLINLFVDAIETSLITKGSFTHSSGTPGLLTWSEDLQYQITGDNRQYVLRAGNVTIPNGDVAYIAYNRNLPFNSANQNVAWNNGQAYINTIGGAIGLFANLSQGDWVKRPTDPDSYYLQVVAFYDSANGGGAITTPANAKSVVLNGTYQGPTINDVGVYDQGIYSTGDSPADVIVSARNNPAIAALGGDFNWVAYRDDLIGGIASIATTSLAISNITCTEDTALVTVSSTTGLANDYYVTITGTTNYNGTYAIELESATTFSITVASTLPTETSGTALFAIVNTAATYIPGSNPLIQLESADHGFANGETISFAGTGTALDGNSYQVAVQDATHFEIGPPSSVTSATGTTTLARLFVRNQNGTMQVVQGVSVDPDGPYDNIKLFIGMAADSQIHPEYATTISNTLEGEENFNTLATENVTNRLSNLTAMMADRAQDKTIKYLPIDVETVSNITSGSNQEVYFSGGTVPYLTILQPGNLAGNAVIALPTSAPGIVLAVNQSAYVSIDRNNATTPTITVVDTTAVPVDENIFVIASRLNETEIYLWNGSEWPLGQTSFQRNEGINKVTLYDPVDTTLPTGSSIVIDGVTVTAGMLVLFSALGSGNNEVYYAVGTGSTITGWTAQYIFEGELAPTTGDLVIITQGTSFINQIGEFNGTTWQFNNIVRYFGSGGDVLNYWEQSGLMTTSLTDATTNGTVFTVGYVGSQNMVIDYSILRTILGTEYKETGSLYVTTDGINVSVSEGGASLNGSSGVSFSAVISSSNLILQYTTTSASASATMKYSIKRWSDSAGGPSGPPSYSAAGGTGVTSLNGESGAVTLVAGANITITPSGSNITIASSGGGGPALQGPFTILDNQVSPATIFSYTASTALYSTFEYSVLKGGSYRVGRLLVATDGTSTTSESDDFVETGTSGVILSAMYSGGNVNIQYTSTSTGSNGTMKFYLTSWS